MSHVIRNGTRLANLNKNILTGKIQLLVSLSLYHISRFKRDSRINIVASIDEKLFSLSKRITPKIPAYDLSNF